ncbi:hypothetical protein VQ044_17565 [Aurantimonas sp. C2-5-R2]|uniref:hypothetical protein n=3 Tax=Aurantimonas TaxID=182269 RepID=UPI002E1815C2|nr:hypothetical protein [Aurantimonas sp. A3-2-R12]MEC5411837.1 hypothetical protein [Aurantimonas sp. C2-4-R8]
MNFTTTTMSAPRISVSDAAASDEKRNREEKAARAAGWRRADLRWERLQEDAEAAWRSGDADQAIRLWRRARRLAFWRFRRSDPRYATSLANAALAERLSGQEARAHRLYARARGLWSGADSFIAGMRIARRARSSLFHLRMEAKHWDTYQQSTRTRMKAFAREAAEALAALERGEPPVCRLHDRWRAEKLPVFDDPRKFLAAALMISTGLTTKPENKD